MGRTLLYKFLNEDGSACNGGSGKWPLPQADHPGDWLRVEGDLVPCENGLHLVKRAGLLDWIGPTLYEIADYDSAGAVSKDEHVLVVRAACLRRRLPGINERTLRLFACWCVRNTPLADGRVVWDLLTNKRSRKAVEVAERFANGEATQKELAAARAAARDVAWAAARAVARDVAWEAARAAAWAADRDAARAAARAADWAAAWAAARDAARAAQLKEFWRKVEEEYS